MSKTILCVDDDKQIRELIQTYLEGKGYKVITSVDGWDCLREIIVKKPDLILMDVNMPKLDGLNTLDMIKMTRIDNHIPIILVSGEGDRETITKAAKLGADDFLVKPFSFEDLGARVAAQLFHVDYPLLRDLLANGNMKASTAFPGLDLAKYQDWVAHAANYQGVELCVLLPKGMAPKAAAKLNDNDAAHQIVILQKMRNHWKCAWPHARMAGTKAA